MATIPRASTILLKICLLLITAINIAAADRRSVLGDLYKQAAEQNRPLILVVDNHSKDDRRDHQGHGVHKESKHDSVEAIPLHYLYPKASVSLPKSVNAQEKYANKDSKVDLLKFYLSRLLSQNQGSRGVIKKKVGRSYDRDDVWNQEYRNYYKDERYQRDRRDQYRAREKDTKYNRRPVDRYYRPRESREYKIRSKYYSNRPEDRDRHDRDRYNRDRRDRYRSERDREERDRLDRFRSDRNREDRDRVDRYRSERDREDRDRVDRYRSEKDRVDRDRIDRYWQDRNKGRENYKIIDWYRDDRDRYQYPSQQRYQPYRSKDRYTDNYGADVLKNLLRISNNLNCEAKYACKGACWERSRMLRQNGDNCEDLCDEKYDCDESEEKVDKVEKKDTGDCDARESGDSCGDEKGNANVSTRGYTDKDEEEECVDNKRC